MPCRPSSQPPPDTRDITTPGKQRADSHAHTSTRAHTHTLHHPTNGQTWHPVIPWQNDTQPPRARSRDSRLPGTGMCAFACERVSTSPSHPHTGFSFTSLSYTAPSSAVSEIHQTWQLLAANKDAETPCDRSLLFLRSGLHPPTVSHDMAPEPTSTQLLTALGSAPARRPRTGLTRPGAAAGRNWKLPTGS